jgi:hypothetical protein
MRKKREGRRKQKEKTIVRKGPRRKNEGPIGRNTGKSRQKKEQRKGPIGEKQNSGDTRGKGEDRH